ncbi:hypothetical protein XI06_14210 [Bradyrhizobium sp. CCBAU 11434]|uniref:DUF3987 domain-containing protein n=1 Tax=Bradyrhizobium sp. CCBAU 11434 TaxID=1630885 RepID=UPI00230668D2|nr:DUF3987 domain-containing protein [Bradyrhizobium sp. CCBAU 11434]MDA9521473.1 hypothetical protein [Bradyrhizobium sp. CCBAU 11434]
MQDTPTPTPGASAGKVLDYNGAGPQVPYSQIDEFIRRIMAGVPEAARSEVGAPDTGSSDLDYNRAGPQISPKRQHIDIADIRARVHGDARGFVEWLYSGRAAIHRSGAEARIGNVEGEAGSSLSIRLTGADAGLWKDHATDEGGDLITLYMLYMNYADTKENFVLAVKEIARDFLHDKIEFQRPLWTPTAETVIRNKKEKYGDKPLQDEDNSVLLGAPVATYSYFDAEGNIVAQVMRYDLDSIDEHGKRKKTFRPHCFREVDGKPKWITGAPDVRPLYRLPQISKTHIVVLVEGEKCADALAGVDIAATSAMGGAEAPIDKTDWSPLAGKTVIIWPDNDDPSKAYARKVSPHLVALGCRVLGVDPPTDSAPKWDAADCIAEGKHPRDLINSAKPVVSITTDPVDVWAKFDPPTLPRGLLPDVIERFAFAQGMDMGADMGGIALSALTVCAAAIPDKVQLQVKRHGNWLESARLWSALVGLPSSMKSPMMAAAVRPLRQVDTDMALRYAKARAAYDALSKEQKAQTEPPQQKRLLLHDTTIEAAQEVLKDSPDGVLCYQDELSGWFGAMDKYSGGRGAAKDRAFWLEAFNGATYSVNRVGRGAVFIKNLSVSLIGGIQPDPIRKLAGDSADDGLLQRLVPIMLQSAVAGRDDEETSPVVAEYDRLVKRLHNLSETDAKVLKFDEGAQQYRQELERRHLELQACEAINPKLAAHIGKYNGLFARLCIIWHCCEADVDKVGNTHDFNFPVPELLPLISEQTARRVGAFLHRFLLPHALAFYAGVLGLSNDHDRLTSVAGYILAHRLEKLTNRDIQRGDRTMRNLSRSEFEVIFEHLDALGWIDRVPGPRPSSPPHWIVNPLVHSKFAERAVVEAERRARDRKMIAELMGKTT